MTISVLKFMTKYYGILVLNVFENKINQSKIAQFFVLHIVDLLLWGALNEFKFLKRVL